MSLVLDSSVTLAWLYSDEITEAIEQVFSRVTAGRTWVPSLWRLEIANSLQSAVRRGRIEPSFRDAALADLSLLDILADPDTDAHAWSTTLQLAQRYRLTLYDAAYLELAHRLQLPLATLDEVLRTAATSLGIPLLGKI